MTLDIEREAKQWFDRLIDLAEADREPQLRTLARERPDLADRVAELLRAAEVETSFARDIVQGAAQAAARTNAASANAGPTNEEDLVGQQIGAYLVRRRIASGGMGSVYEAEQSHPIERTVALKVVRTGFSAAPEIVRRFEAERQALSIMNHSAIARVFDAGAALNGEPYFVMELVEGHDLSSYAAREQLTIEQRLALFLRICDGVEHAHRKGIVHRDLKPSNVLVTTEEARAQPKIIDFGIAKALDPTADAESGRTLVGTTLGTLDYMSPEQAGLARDVDTRTDVYALGGLLYELLVGSRPIPAEQLRDLSLEAAQRRIRELPIEPLARRAARLRAGDPALEQRRVTGPQLVRRLRGDLEAICERALAKEPEERYGSVEAFAEDLRRHLRHEPIVAQPPGLLGRARRLVRRNRLASVASALLLLSIIAGIAGLAFGLRRAQIARDLAQAEAERTDRVASFLADLIVGIDAQQLGTAMTAEIRDALVEDLEASGSTRGLLDRLDPALARVNKPDAARAVLDEQLLRQAAATIEEQFADDPVVRARLQLTLFEAYGNLTLYGRAEEVGLQGVADHREAFGDDHPETLYMRSVLGNLYKSRGRFAEAEEIHRDILGRRTQLLGALDPQTISSLDNLGMALEGQRRHGDAYEIFERAYEAKLKAFGPDDPQTLRQMYSLGVQSTAVHRYDQAIDLLTRVRDAYHASEGETGRLTLAARQALANALTELGRFEDSERELQTIVAANVEQFGDDNVRTMVTRDFLGYLYTEAMRFPEAEAMFTRVAPAYATALGANHMAAVGARGNQAWSAAHQGRLADGERGLLAAVAALRQSYAEGARELWPYSDVLAWLAVQQGRVADARRTTEQTLDWIAAEATDEASTPAGPDDDLDLLPHRLRHAWVLLYSTAPEDLSTAYEMLAGVRDRYAQLYGPDHHETARATLLAAEAGLRSADLQPDAAASAIDDAVERLESTFGVGAYGVAEAYVRQAAAQVTLGDRAAALAALERAVDAGALPFLIDSHSAFAPLRDDANFRQLAERARGRIS